jgi:hypothetical protein
MNTTENSLTYFQVKELLDTLLKVIDLHNQNTNPVFCLEKIAIKNTKKYNNTIELVLMYPNKKGFLLNVNSIYFHPEFKNYPATKLLMKLHENLFTKENYKKTTKYFFNLDEIVIINPTDSPLAIAKKIFSFDDHKIFYEKQTLEAMLDNNSINLSKKMKI